MPRYIRNKWTPDRHPPLKKGDYVVATKYADGDPGDQFCVGFYDGCDERYGQIRHRVVDSNGRQFRHNGFRRVAKIGAKRGGWIVQHLPLIEAQRDRFSVWHWFRAPWAELRNAK